MTLKPLYFIFCETADDARQLYNKYVIERGGTICGMVGETIEDYVISYPVLKYYFAYQTRKNSIIDVYTDQYFNQYLLHLYKDDCVITFKDFEEKMQKELRVIESFVKKEPSFLLGFEVEGFILPDFYKDLIEYVTDLYKKDFSIHEDASLWNVPEGYQAFEISSPALPENIALEKLEELIVTLTLLSEAKVFITDKSCGFHVNISEKNLFPKTELHEKRNKFAYEFMNRFDPNKWKKIYRRQKNKYCAWDGAPTTLSDVITDRFTKHRSAISTESLHCNNRKIRRIEVRVGGNKDYHCKYKNLSDFMLDIRDAMSHAHASI